MKDSTTVSVSNLTAYVQNRKYISVHVVKKKIKNHLNLEFSWGGEGNNLNMYLLLNTFQKQRER